MLFSASISTSDRTLSTHLVRSWRLESAISYTLGDYHIYKNHLDQVNELLSRSPLPLPKLRINDDDKRLRGLDGLLRFRYEHLSLVGYESHAKIAAPVAV